MGIIGEIFGKDEPGYTETENVYYEGAEKNIEEMVDKGSKMILLEPRAFSESQQIADHLKNSNTVVINLRRVTSDQAKKIIDFVSGAIYALQGHIEKIGNGIFLCTPNNVNVQGKISSDKEVNEIYNNDDIDIDW